MKDQLISTDIRFIAKGYFERYFFYRFYPKVKLPWITALITFLAGIALILTDYLMQLPNEVTTAHPASPVDWIAIALIFTAMILFLKGLQDYQSDKADFINLCVDKWEREDKTIPSLETLKEYLKSKGAL